LAIQCIDPRHERNPIFSQDGINCEILRPDAQGWNKEIVRVSVEFMPVPNAIELEACPPENDKKAHPLPQILWMSFVKLPFKVTHE
jgi:KGK domain